MGKLTTFAAILVIAFGTLGFNYSPCDNLQRNDVSKNEQRRLKIEANTRANVCKSALRWKGVVEITGKNDHPMIERSMKLCGLCYPCGYAWCAACLSEIFDYAGLSATISARARDWFKANVVWDKRWDTPLPYQYMQPGMAVGYRLHGNFYENHVEMLYYASKKYAYVAGGNTSRGSGFNPDTMDLTDGTTDGTVQRDADGFYFKVRPWYSVDVISDKCLLGKDFDNRYYEYLKAVTP